MVGCSAYGCTNRSEKGFSLKSFPTDPTKRTVWILAVNRKNWSPSPHSRLCEVHFEADQFEKPDVEGKVKLKRSAVPTLFAHKKPLKKRPPPKIRSSLPKKQKMHSEVFKKETEEEDIDQVQPDDSELDAELKIKLEDIDQVQPDDSELVAELKIKLEDIDQVQPDDSELVAELKIKLKRITDENRRLRSQLAALNKKLTSFLKEDLPENFCPDS